MAQKAPKKLDIPSAKVARSRLHSTVIERHRKILESLPEDGKISVALDCWTSPFAQAFMAVTGYFIDEDWNYRELLLGFEPLSGAHSGVSLSAVLLQLLQKYALADRVLTITTDNASNNNTLVASIQESVQSLDLGDNTAIIRVPCMAHVIQLSLKQLLGQMKADPKNNTAQAEWTESQEQSVRARHQNREIVDTLNKLRSLAIFINASPQRREAFLNLQTASKALVPIQDVHEFCSKYGHPHLQLDQEQWRQIDYLLLTTEPFFRFTTALSKTKDVTVHLIFAIYNKLFDHLEKLIRQLRRKKVAWKKLMLTALRAAEEKLRQYYSKTEDVHGDIFAIGTMLAPQHKLRFFRSREWGGGPELVTRYRQSFKDYFEPYKQRRSKEQTSSDQEPFTLSLSLDLDQMVSLSQVSQAYQQDELTTYLDSATTSTMPIRAFWKENQATFPILAKLARDILSIPATGAGVERLFNTARDICHYRRGSLNATTIQEIMLYRCTTEFEVQKDAIAVRNEYFPEGEIETDYEEKDGQQLEDIIEPISDNEGGNEDDTQAVVALTPAELVRQGPSERSLGKRRKSVASESDTDGRMDDEEDIPLPKTQQRVSGRSRKRPRHHDDQFILY
ncbi:hypothetical protein N7460_007564 [Penicillium canescens]|uniref:HAT C-terminal dimerisation domain-containing protein n=1 Tax=Penicillium canescens TaxID=5083 RepID=A0AAD6IA87_PENCN|nr:hypothetical protein N7460_007564 [Penicillium canescens]